MTPVAPPDGAMVSVSRFLLSLNERTKSVPSNAVIDEYWTWWTTVRRFTLTSNVPVYQNASGKFFDAPRRPMVAHWFPSRV